MLKNPVTRRVLSTGAALAAAVGIGLASAPAASAAGATQAIRISDWHCSKGGVVFGILGFSNFPNGWTYSGGLRGNTINVVSSYGQNYAYAAVQCDKGWMYGPSRYYNQQITSPMYYWSYSDRSGTKNI